MRNLASLAAAAFLLGVPSAQAFVRTVGCNASGDTCSELLWPTNCSTYAIDAASEVNTGIPLDALVEEIDASFAAWNDLDCSFLQIQSEGLIAGEEVGFSGEGVEVNLVTFVREGWLGLGPGHDPGAIALTSVFFDPKTGAIVNADIEFNAEFFEPVIVGQFDGIDPNRVDADIRNTLTHEVGHFLGLDHTPIADATMFFVADENETEKQTLEADDIAGACAIYPLAEDPGFCELPGFLPPRGLFQCSVQTSGASPVEVLGLGALLLLGSLWLRRRRRV